MIAYYLRTHTSQQLFIQPVDKHKQE